MLQGTTSRVPRIAPPFQAPIHFPGRQSHLAALQPPVKRAAVEPQRPFFEGSCTRARRDSWCRSMQREETQPVQHRATPRSDQFLWKNSYRQNIYLRSSCMCLDSSCSTFWRSGMRDAGWWDGSLRKRESEKGPRAEERPPSSFRSSLLTNRWAWGTPSGLGCGDNMRVLDFHT